MEQLKQYAILMLATLIVIGCGGDDSATGSNGNGNGDEGPTTGAVKVTTKTTGKDKDADGYTLSIDGGQSKTANPSSTITFEDLDEGKHSLQLSGTADNCSAKEKKTQNIAVFVGETTKVSYSINCKQQLKNRIVFSKVTSGSYDLYMMKPDGSKQQQITSSQGKEINPAISPNGTQIAYVKNEKGSYEYQLHIIDIDGSDDQIITTGGGGSSGFGVPYTPAWSPDGSKLAFTSGRSGNPEIFIINADGSNTHNISQSKSDDFLITGAWSPDGKRIVFASDRGKGSNYEIYTMDTDGGDVQQLTNNNAFNREATWSPDGSQIAYLSDAAQNGIYVMSKAGKNQHFLTTTRRPGIPNWSPDGKKIAYGDGSNSSNSADIFKVNADGSSTPKNITKSSSADEFSPFYSPLK